MATFGTYPTLVNSTSAGAKGEIAAIFATFRTFIATKAQGAGSSMPTGGFDQIPPVLATQLCAEIDAAALAIANGP